jgi:hypothetical protein
LILAETVVDIWLWIGFEISAELAVLIFGGTVMATMYGLYCLLGWLAWQVVGVVGCPVIGGMSTCMTACDATPVTTVLVLLGPFLDTRCLRNLPNLKVSHFIFFRHFKCSD